MGASVSFYRGPARAHRQLLTTAYRVFSCICPSDEKEGRRLAAKMMSDHMLGGKRCFLLKRGLIASLLIWYDNAKDVKIRL